MKREIENNYEMHSVGVIIFTSEGRLGPNQFTLQMQSQYYVQLRVGISTEKPDFVKWPVVPAGKFLNIVLQTVEFSLVNSGLSVWS